MGGGGGGGKGVSTPKVQQVEAPVVAATAPEPAAVAEAPKVSETARNQESNKSKRKGASALRIDLNVGGSSSSGGASSGGGGGGLSIPT